METNKRIFIFGNYQGIIPFPCDCSDNSIPYHFILKGKYAKKKKIMLLKCMNCGKESVVGHKTVIETQLKLRRFRAES